MKKIAEIESQRALIQRELDDATTRAEKNQTGQFSTPYELAKAVMVLTSRIATIREPIRFMDPAFGTGVFLSVLLEVFGENDIESTLGFEIDRTHAEAANRIWNDYLGKLRLEDFTQSEPPCNLNERPNLIVCNPPYIRHQHLSVETKGRLKTAAEKRTGVSPDGTMGFFGYYMLLAHSWMARDCIAAWLIPGEFMDTRYGLKIQEYLTSNVELIRVHRFKASDNQFPNVKVDPCVLWIVNRKPSKSHVVPISYGGSLENPETQKLISVSQLKRERKWLKLLLTDNLIQDGNWQLSDLFNIRRGLATGADGFFIMTEDEAEDRGIPRRFLIPILPSPKQIDEDQILADENGQPILDERLFLLSCSLSIEDVREQCPALHEYLRRGEEEGVSEGYLCSKRDPWYSQESRPPPPFLMTYMGRRSKEGGPYRFIVNHSEATATNSYLMFYPKTRFSDEIEGNSELKLEIWRILRSLPQKLLETEGRVYGGGLYKLEPSELSKIDADRIAAALNIDRGVSNLGHPY